MKSIKKLSKQLQKIESIEKQMKSVKSVDQISIIRFLKYKNCSQKKNEIIRQIKEVKRTAYGAKLLYEYETGCWVDNLSINCRKYKSLERKARYRRDLKLFKCGFLEDRPIPPFIQFIQSKFPNLDISNNVFFKKIRNDIINFKSNILPQKINKIAINSAKLCIRGYKKAQKNYECAKAYVLSQESAKYIRKVFENANKELAYADEAQESIVRADNDKVAEYKASLKVQPQSSIKLHRLVNNNEKNATQAKRIYQVEL